MPTHPGDFEALARISSDVEQDLGDAGEDVWGGSPFAWIRTRASRTRGAIGERMVSQLCREAGLEVTRPTSSQSDRRIAGVNVEIKTSTLWAAGMYRFSQIRDQDYDFALFLGLSPFEVHMWLAPKDVLRAHVIGHLGQHSGAGSQETAWFGFEPEAPPSWLAPYGPTSARVLELLRAARRP